jgi:hypothetical protein
MLFRRSGSSRTFSIHFICLKALVFEIFRHTWFGERAAFKGRLGKGSRYIWFSASIRDVLSLNL